MHIMKKVILGLHLLGSLVCFTSSCSDSDKADEKMSVEERMTNARAAKAGKKADKAVGVWVEKDKALPPDYQAPVDKVLKGPNGEVVRTGERGAKFYINKNGNKTYLSSNQ